MVLWIDETHVTDKN